MRDYRHVPPIPAFLGLFPGKGKVRHPWRPSLPGFSFVQHRKGRVGLLQYTPMSWGSINHRAVLRLVPPRVSLASETQGSLLLDRDHRHPPWRK